MKKIKAIITAFVLLFQLFPALVSANTEDGLDWEYTYHGTYADDSMREGHVAGVSEVYSYDGDRALNIKCYTSERNDENYIEIKNQFKKSLASGKYVIEFYVKKNNTASDGEIHIGDKVIKCSEMDIAAAAAPSGETNWKKYSTEFDYTASENDYFSLRFFNNVKTYFIDNISFVANGTTENMLSDSGFEERSVVDPVPEPDPDPEPDIPPVIENQSEYEPEKLMVSNTNNTLILNWINPAAETLEKITVYDITDGEDVFVSDELNITPSKTVYHKLENLTDGKKYQYKVIFSFADIGDVTYFLTGTSSGSTTKKYGGLWTGLGNKAGTAGYCPADSMIDTEVYNSGKASLKIVSNIDDSYSEMVSNIYYNLYQTLPLELGKTYKISFFVKTENTKSHVQSHMSWVKFDGQNVNYIPDSKGTMDWTKVEYEYTYSEKNIFMILYDRLCGAIWVDDFECYELDEDKNIIGDNLFVCGDFEGLITAPEAEISGLESDTEPGMVTLSWNKGTNYSGANIYQLVSDKYEYRGKVNSDISEITIDKLRQLEDYTFRIIPLNTDGIEGKAEDITVSVPMADYIVNKPILKKGGVKVDTLSGGGDYVLSVSAKNNAVEDGLNYEAVAVLYDSEKTCVKAYSFKDSVAISDVNGKYSEKQVTVTVPEGEGYHLEVYVVDSRKTLNRYYGTVVY